ncbi:MAG: hypothetical protein PHN89_05695, partial [Candidatus Pacebacteria bacterium]|nr:hypothetical protein [Candidatus Paceibacterota bacterium]
MFYLIIGIVFLFFPYLAIFTYKSAIDGFLKIFSYSALFYLAVSIGTQFFHIFKYPIILGFFALYALAWLVIIFKRRESLSLLPLKNNWIFFLALLIIFVQLFMVHRFYTGTVDTFQGLKHVSHSSYVYPFFSDEWVTASLVNYTIDNNALPLANPFSPGASFVPNILFAFSSLLAEIFLLTGLNPVTQYYLFAIFFGVIIGASVYATLKAYEVNTYIAAATMLFALSILNSGNVAGLWILIPLTFGLIFLLWQIISQRQGKYMNATLYVLLTLVMYPPMVVFSVPVLIAGFARFQKKNSSKTIFPSFVPFCAFLSVLAFIRFLLLSRLHMTFAQLFDTYALRPDLNPGISSYALWNVLPLFVVFLAVAGVYTAMNKKYYDLII